MSAEQEEQETPIAERINWEFDDEGVPILEEVIVPSAPHDAGEGAVQDGPRLMISHITNEFFKSYAGTINLGPFHKNFTGIVGPNGSGKSNVIDSMLFVFGFRASKIRTKKISVLIHNSDGYEDVQSCSVTVHFQKIINTGDGDDDYEVVDGSKFRVSRTAFRDNSSYYKVNDKKVTFKEVGALLRQSGIDLDHNRFLILQGEVEQISMMKPKALTEHEEGMLEYLEDIVGSTRFKKPIECLNVQIENLNELRSEKLNRVKIVEKEKDDLESVKNEAVGYLKTENEVVALKHTLYQIFLSILKKQSDSLIGKRDSLQSEMQGMLDKLEELEKGKAEKSKELAEVMEKFEEISLKGEEMKETFQACTQKDIQVRDELKHNKLRMKKLSKTIEEEKVKVAEFDTLPGQLKKENEKLSRELETLGDRKKNEEKKLEEAVQSLKSETEHLQELHDQEEAKLLQLQKSVNETQSVMSIAQSELDQYLRHHKSATTRLADLKESYEKGKISFSDAKSDIQELKKKIPEIKKQLAKEENRWAELKKRENELQAERDECQGKVTEMQVSLQSSKNKNHVAKALMDMKNSGKIPGIVGRLGDLGVINEKYDVAISTACSALDNILVDSIHTATECVSFLKKNKVGVATFIALDKMNRWNANCRQGISTPENIPRLFDLVQSQKPEYRPAFYYALRDTLVADNLDQATRCAYGARRFRVVTLQGELIDMSGTMSGGGGRVSKGRMGNSVVEQVDPKVLEQNQNRLQQISQELSQVHGQIMSCEESIPPMRRELVGAEQSLASKQHQVELVSQQFDLQQRQIDEQVEVVRKTTPDKKKLSNLESEVKTHKIEYDKAAAAATKVEEKVNRLRDEIVEISKKKLGAAEGRLKDVKKKLASVQAQITKNSASTKSAGRNKQKVEDKVLSLQEESKEVAEKVAKLEEKFKKLEQKATKVMEGYQAIKDEIATMSDKKDNISKLVADIDNEVQAFQSDNISFRHKMEKFETDIRDAKGKMNKWEKSLNQLKVNEIEDEDIPELKMLTDDELASCESTRDIEFQITTQEESLKKINPKMSSIKEFKKKESQYLERVNQLNKVTSLRDDQRQKMEGMKKTRLNDFMKGFTLITTRLKEMYRMITLGGDAELELVDSMDPFSEGVVFSVRPPKKSWKNICNLSGGEKTLSSLALVFALHHYKPTPLYVMDEIDAALDFKNVSIVANYIKERTKNAQFVIISLRNNMFELADQLVGIYKTSDCTKSVTVIPKLLTIGRPKTSQPVELMQVEDILQIPAPASNP